MNRERVFYLFDRHADGNWTAEEKQELEVYLSNSPEVQGWFWEHATLSTLLREACQLEAGQEMADIDTPTEPIAPVIGLPSESIIQNPGDTPASHPPAGGGAINQALGFIGELFSGRSGGLALPKFLVVVVASMVVGSLLTMLIWNQRGQNRDTVAADSDVSSPDSMQETATAATLVNLTNCRWNPARSTADVRGGTIRPGQSLNLLEGVAEIKTEVPNGSVGRFQLEGPLEMMLTSQGTPNLQYGKLAAEVACDFDRQFTLDTPLGSAVITQQASIGLIVSGNEMELHVFAGEAAYEPLWPMSMVAGGSDLTVTAGQSIVVSTSPDGSFAVREGSADMNRFVTHVDMTASRLDITDDYVAAIRKAKPIGYWRFESDAGGMVRNEMADRFHCRIHGDGLRWRSYSGNRSAEFGSRFESGEFGSLMSDESLGSAITDDYSLETWIKPNHCHRSAFFSLITEPKPFPAPVSVGLLFELQGPVEDHNFSILHSGQIRFLHRNPPGAAGGKQCYSDNRYALRKWQHVVGVKQGPDMRLYLDGRQVAMIEDSTPLAADMRILVGQLYPHDPARSFIMRPFVGELDEIALYDRALTETEVVGHYQLARPIADRRELRGTTAN